MNPRALSSPAAHASRRRFLGATIALAPGVLPAQSAPPPPQPRPLALGLDNFAVRALRWEANRLIDYAASLRLDALFITDLNAFPERTPSRLADLRARAADRNLALYLGSGSICPSSKSFRPDFGTAEEHLALGIGMAKALGSPVFRVVLGSMHDRSSAGGIQARIADTIRVCRACRTRALDAGVTIAIENHAGDMQSRELLALVEAAGTDFVGVNLDAGNACWALEDPAESLEILGPRTVCTSLRDSVVWETDRGARVQWTAMGEGAIDWPRYFQRFAVLCPNAPVNIETISGAPMDLPYLTPEFWRAYPAMSARDFARFIAMARRGRPLPPFQAPRGKAGDAARGAYQRAELERSIRYCRDTLGLGRAGR